MYEERHSKQEQRFDYDADPRWQQKPFTPAQLLVNDVRLETLSPSRGPMLEITARSPHLLVPQHAAYTQSEDITRIYDATSNPIERRKLTDLEGDFGWLRHLRLGEHQLGTAASGEDTKCRWIHCAARFPEYLRGFLWAMYGDSSTIADSLKVLDHVVQRETRFSKHGKYFSPFSEVLRSPATNVTRSNYPMLISAPFMDWSTGGPTPPLRFQIDKREGFRSARSSAHLLRSILQHYYRLEDTVDRERSQVFAKHKPWNTNRELDLKVRQWYGYYPTGLNVDELWILMIDPKHIVTFSSNQTWKAVWPPLQLPARISDVAFRGIRNSFFAADEDREYDAMTHAIACLSGAVGMMHRNFWTDMVLCLADRYAGQLSHLQYRLHRSASAKLVMDLIACLEELNIVIQITEDQLRMIHDLRPASDSRISNVVEQQVSPTKKHDHAREEYSGVSEFEVWPSIKRRATYRQLSASGLSDPLAQLIDNLQRELADLRDLRDNTDRQVTRTIQLVNIRLEDHGKAILVFTVVTIIFLPLNFVSSFFGMNFSDIRDMTQTQWLFWAVALCVTVGVVAISLAVAFSGASMLEKMRSWRDSRKEQRVSTTTVLRAEASSGQRFQVYGVDKAGW